MSENIRYVPIAAAPRRLDDSELKAALRDVRPDDPVWLAANQILQEFLDNARSQASDPQMADRPGALAHTNGGVEWLSFLQAKLHSYREK